MKVEGGGQYLRAVNDGVRTVVAAFDFMHWKNELYVKFTTFVSMQLYVNSMTLVFNTVIPLLTLTILNFLTFKAIKQSMKLYSQPPTINSTPGIKNFIFLNQEI